MFLPFIYFLDWFDIFNRVIEMKTHFCLNRRGIFFLFCPSFSTKMRHLYYSKYSKRCDIFNEYLQAINIVLLILNVELKTRFIQTKINTRNELIFKIHFLQFNTFILNTLITYFQNQGRTNLNCLFFSFKFKGIVADFFQYKVLVMTLHLNCRLTDLKEFVNALLSWFLLSIYGKEKTTCITIKFDCLFTEHPKFLNLL